MTSVLSPFITWVVLMRRSWTTSSPSFSSKSVARVKNAKVSEKNINIKALLFVFLTARGPRFFFFSLAWPARRTPPKGSGCSYSRKKLVQYLWHYSMGEYLTNSYLNSNWLPDVTSSLISLCYQAWSCEEKLNLTAHGCYLHMLSLFSISLQGYVTELIVRIAIQSLFQS